MIKTHSLRNLITVVVLLCATALASITLTNSVVIAQGGNTLETDPAAGVNSFNIYYSPGSTSANTLTVNVYYGTVSTNAIQSGQFTPLTWTVNINTGAWTTNTNQSGTLSGPNLTTLQNTLKNNRNSLESLFISLGLTPGTQVNWNE